MFFKIGFEVAQHCNCISRIGKVFSSRWPGGAVATCLFMLKERITGECLYFIIKGLSESNSHRVPSILLKCPDLLHFILYIVVVALSIHFKRHLVGVALALQV